MTREISLNPMVLRGNGILGSLFARAVNFRESTDVGFSKGCLVGERGFSGEGISEDAIAVDVSMTSRLSTFTMYLSLAVRAPRWRSIDNTPDTVTRASLDSPSFSNKLGLSLRSSSQIIPLAEITVPGFSVPTDLN